MVTPGFFSSQSQPASRLWFNDKNVAYIQQEVTRRLANEFEGTNEVAFDFARERLHHTYYYWRGPLTLDELLEKTICDLVSDIRTEIEMHTRFDHFDPMTLYDPGTGLTREEKVKLRKPFKFEFQMNY